MSFRRRHFLLSLILFSILLSCDKSDDPALTVCRPEYARTGTDSIVYNYSSTNRLISIQYYNAFGIHLLQYQDDLTYDSKNNLTGFVHNYYSFSDKAIHPIDIYELSYTSDNKPDTLKRWGGVKNDYPFITKFSYDSKGRLERRDAFVFKTSFTDSYRYEYDAKDNVSKIFFKRINSDEYLGRENIEFDNQRPFYAASKDLETVNVYIYRYQPNQNNCKKSIITGQNPYTTFLQPVTVDYKITYNEKGLINSLSTDNILIEEFFYRLLNYKCN
jgi:hypothetical protein